jgi:Ca-activated chloride channel homolog
MSSMEFAKPYLLIIGIIGLTLWALSYFKIFKKAEFYLPKGSLRTGVSVKKLIVFMVGIAAWVLISISLGQPRSSLGFAKNNIKVNDIFFVVDVSRSMLAEDFVPNRLEAAKKKMQEFVELRPTDRIGVIMFSEKAFTLLPLSTDLKLVRSIIDEINISRVLGMGTNIGDALGLAVGRASQSLAENKVIILLTDGVSNVGNMPPIQAAEQAKEQGVKVYTIGIGGKTNKRVLRSGVGGGGHYQRIPGGSIDVETLDEIAKITGGRSYLADTSGALDDVLNEIQKLEKTEIKSSQRIIYKEHYYFFLLYGAICLVLSELLRRLWLKEAY